MLDIFDSWDADFPERTQSLTKRNSSFCRKTLRSHWNKKTFSLQLNTFPTLPLSVLKRAWQGFCLDPNELKRIFCLCEVYKRSDSVPFLHFLAVAGGMLTKVCSRLCFRSKNIYFIFIYNYAIPQQMAFHSTELRYSCFRVYIIFVIQEFVYSV